MKVQVPRLSDMEYEILRLLMSDSNAQWYGLDLVNKSDGQLKRGTVYVTLQRMESKGLVASEKEQYGSDSVVPRRFYKPTPAGIYAWEALEQFRAALNQRPLFA